MKTSLGAKTLLYPTPVLVVGTFDENGQPNVMTVAWGGVCCSKPPCVAISIRKATHTYASIMLNEAFTINVPGESHLKAADYFGIASGKNVNKFIETGLTPEKSGLVNAPYISEFPLVLECRLKQTLELGLHTLFVGEILDVKADNDVIDSNGVVIMDKLKPVVFAPESRNYHKIGDVAFKAFSTREAPKEQ
jgi:flavin reductase (DIM6/NTAB) family NADH-FMN oxidoreductase RutF